MDHLAVARAVASSCQVVDGVSIVIVTGSVARGLADDASDLDLYIYRSEAGSDSPARAVLAELGGVLLFGVPTVTGRFEKYRLSGRYVDVEQVDVGVLDHIAQVLADGTADDGAIKAAAGVRDALPLYGEVAWDRRRASFGYSDALAVTEVGRRSPRLLPVRTLYDLTFMRGDAVSYAARAAAVVLDAVGLLAAANRTFIPTGDPKWLPWHLARLPVAPARCNERMQRALRVPGPEACDDLDLLLREVLDIVDATVAGASTAVGRFALGLGRKAP